MQLRPPSVPLITIDPFFSVWSPADRLTDRDTTHWTGRANLMVGVAEIDGVKYRFMGRGPEPAMTQAALKIEACSTEYVFTAGGVQLVVNFTSPLLLDDLDLLTRPVVYLGLFSESLDGHEHDVSVSISFSEQFCMNEEGDAPVAVRKYKVEGLNAIRMENAKPRILERDGDDHRIEWGALVLASDTATFAKTTRKKVTFQVKSINDHARAPEEKTADLTFITATCKPDADGALITVAYDDLGQSLRVWGDPCASVWNKDGKTIDKAIAEAWEGYEDAIERCSHFSAHLYADAVLAGGEKYAEILLLAYRQAIAAHKLVIDKHGELLFVSKECFSNGCAATVDVSYPSIPLFLLYNPELVKALMRPIYRFARSKDWPFDFAPHDAGRYPFIDFQRYSCVWETRKQLPQNQMPVEECGNMLVMEAAAAIASDDASFAESHLDLLRQWVKYLLDNGADPGNQLCTDDFAGHLAHNCNLALKAIMGIASLAIILEMLGKDKEAAGFIKKARALAKDWLRRAANDDGSFRLAFDQPGSTSMKYNIVWDKLFGTELMPESFFAAETAGALKRQLPYGLPLDSRKAYTKSDWLVWTATLAADKADFEAIVAPLWEAYHRTPSRVPLTDWYWTDTSEQRGFQARSVQGGLFMKLLQWRGL
jgi:hypothetical protein